MNVTLNLIPEKLTVTHKTYNFIDNGNKLTFLAKTDTTKFLLFTLFDVLNVKILKINVMRYKPEIVGFRSKKGKSSSFKKFIVTFDSSEKSSDVLDKMIAKRYVANK